MTTYKVTETTINGEELDCRKDLDADSFDDAVAKYVKQHKNTGSICGLDVGDPDNEYKWYSLSTLRGMNYVP